MEEDLRRQVLARRGLLPTGHFPVSESVELYKRQKATRLSPLPLEISPKPDRSQHSEAVMASD